MRQHYNDNVFIRFRQVIDVWKSGLQSYRNKRKIMKKSTAVALYLSKTVFSTRVLMDILYVRGGKTAKYRKIKNFEKR